MNQTPATGRCFITRNQMDFMKGNWFYLVLLLVAIGYFGGRYLYFKPKFERGEEAMDFTARLIDGTDFRLSGLRGDYVLLDFWGSWCGPCRKENPGLVALHEKYGNARFEDGGAFHIVSVALETSEASWKRAINRDRLDWRYHIVQMESFQSPVPQLYGIREIPTKYLVGPEGAILHVNPSIDEVDAILSRQINAGD